MKSMVITRKRAAAFLVCAVLAAAVLTGYLLYFGKVILTSADSKKLPIYSVETDKKQLALGFNCAWDDKDIPVLLDILDRYEIKATFFMVGTWCETYPQSAKLLVEKGHEIGNHSDKHPDMTKMNATQIKEDILAAHEKIKEATGVAPTLFRAPSGAYNNTVVQTAQDCGYQCIQWDADSIDWKNPTPQDMTKRILKRVQNGSITLFHSGAKNTPEALPMIIEALKEEGYTFVTVGELIYKENYYIDPNGRQCTQKQ